MNLVKQILLLHKSEVPKKDIARQPGISKNTVKSNLAKVAESSPYCWPRGTYTTTTAAAIANNTILKKGGGGLKVKMANLCAYE